MISSFTDADGFRQTTDHKSVSATVRQMIESGGERYWRVGDFDDMSVLAVSQTLSRLMKDGLLQRPGKGLYYHSRETVLGPSQPAASDIDRRTLGDGLRPAGRTASNLLGFTTQNPAQGEYATAANIAPSRMLGRAHVYTRRPESWTTLSDTDAAILDFLRTRGVHAEMDDASTVARLLRLIGEPGRFERIFSVAGYEPARVRAMLGAIGEELGVSRHVLSGLRGQINPLSRFDFGRLRSLKHAHEWQAK